MTTIRSVALRVFPGRTRSSYAVTWRTQRGAGTTDRRLYWGDIDVPISAYDGVPPWRLLELVVEDLKRKAGIIGPSAEQSGAPRGGGGVPHDGQRLPGIDPDE